MSCVLDEGEVLAKLTPEDVSSRDLAIRMGWDHQALIGLLKSLRSDGYAVIDQRSETVYSITEDGEKTLENGSPEFELLRSLPEAGLPMQVVKKNHKIGMGVAMKSKWICIDQGMIKPAMSVDKIVDKLADDLKKLQLSGGIEGCVDSGTLAVLKKRNQVVQIKTTYYLCRRGPKWAPSRVKESTFLTKEMLESGAWKEARFKPTNFHALGANLNGGNLHPLLMARTEFRKVLISMGFEEMPTNKWVESSFWNFDSLFQPQQHPARDAHDTFFIREPSLASLESVPSSLVEKVRSTHQTGGETKSIGHRYEWSLMEARKNLLRTHTTAVSSQMLYKLANRSGGFQPAKYFSIDRVFRNETVDRTHLAEFHQVEGLVADYNLSLGDLIGVIKQFFMEIGIESVRFKPAFNPYTEPSMEIFGYHKGLKKWTEVGNSGMFRPEMLQPLGLPEGVRVIAWGCSLERPTMIKFNVNDIREMFGHRLKLDWAKNSPLPLFKEPNEV